MPVYPTKDSSFWARVTKTPTCWFWTGARTSAGYGHFTFRYQYISAHRFSYELHKGPIPDGLFVMHSCDNPACVNPEHLLTGTQSENISDMVKKERGLVGEKNSGCSLSEEEVLIIRKLHSLGYRDSKLAAFFGVSRRQICNIVNGSSWKHVQW